MSHERLRPEYLFDEEKIKELKQIAPECFEDGKINFETLRQNLGHWVIEENEEMEHFGLSWPGKKDARRLASIPSQGTLEPLYGEGLKSDGTPDTDGKNDSKNIFIEGENLEVLKILHKSYAGKIKMIYIDPPYNTGEDFIYDDDFTEPIQEYLRRTGQLDEEGKPLTTNKRSDGRFHSKWLTMMYSRLRIAREFLSDDGVIFISIDDNEVHNLRAICNEIFGEENFMAQLVWRTDGNFDNQAKFKKCHEYILVYVKEEVEFKSPPVIDPSTPSDSKLFNEEIKNTIVKNGPKNPASDLILPKGFPCELEKGEILEDYSKWPHFKGAAKISNYKLECDLTAYSGWSSKDLILEFIENDFQPIIDKKGQETIFQISKSGAIEVVKKRSSFQSHVITVLTNLGNTQSTGSKLLSQGLYFDYPKPPQLIEYFIKMNHGEDFTVLDFFAGSNTTAEAVIRINNEFQKNLNFITIQFPQPITEGPAYDLGFRKITEISSKRIKVLPENGGFKFFKLRDSNFKIWNSVKEPSLKVLESTLEIFNEKPIKDNWTKKDLLYEVLLIEGFTLSSTQEVLPNFLKNEVIYIEDDYCEHALFLCLDEKIHNETIEQLKLSGQNIFICLDSAISNVEKLRLSDKGLIKTI